MALQSTLLPSLRTTGAGPGARKAQGSLTATRSRSRSSAYSRSTVSLGAASGTTTLQCTSS